MEMVELNMREFYELLTAQRQNAEDNPLSMDDVFDVKNGATIPPGDRPGFTVQLHDQLFTLTHEWQPTGMCRHISMSRGGGEWPLINLSQLVMKQLGFRELLFTKGPTSLAVYQETAQVNGVDRVVIHVLETLEP